jgi:inhibitor of KinA
MKMVPLGDQALLAYCSDEASGFAFATDTRQANFPWLIDIVQAYTTVGVFFDADRIGFEGVAGLLGRLEENRHLRGGRERETVLGPLHLIPCCYEFQLDLDRVAQLTEVTADEVIRLHSQTEYAVYAIGFCPGFPYLGYLPLALANVPRLARPRLRVEAGSVGITGRQTGIYTEVRPGGWNLIGRTPLELVHVADNYFPLRTGDRVRFERIDEREFRRLQGERLPNRESPCCHESSP